MPVHMRSGWTPKALTVTVPANLPTRCSGNCLHALRISWVRNKCVYAAKLVPNTGQRAIERLRLSWISNLTVAMYMPVALLSCARAELCTTTIKRLRSLGYIQT
jgi:hypothetical protein